MWYEPVAQNAPVIHTINGHEQPPSRTNLEIYRILARVSAPWPVPAAGAHHDEQLAAYRYLSHSACACGDLRIHYNAAGNTILTFKEKVARTPFAADHGFGETDFNAVRHQLVTELGHVFLIDGVRGQTLTLLSNQQHMLLPKLTEAYDVVRRSFEVNRGAKVRSVIVGIVQALAGLTALTPVGPVVGALNGVLTGSSNLANTVTGAHLAELETTVGDLGKQTVDGFAGSITAITATYNVVLSNWGRLEALAGAIARHSNEWEIRNPGAVVTALSASIEAQYFRTLVPVVYEEQEGVNLASVQPDRWCTHGIIALCVYASYPAAASYSFAVNDPSADWVPRHDLTVIGERPIVYSKLIGKTRVYLAHPPLPQSLIDRITGPTSAGGLGVYPAYMFERWPFTRIVCRSGADPVNCYKSATSIGSR